MSLPTKLVITCGLTPPLRHAADSVMQARKERPTDVRFNSMLVRI
jgi:hypothetical protein